MQTTPNVSTILDFNLEAGRGHKTAVITATNEEWTFTDLHAATCRVAAHLVDEGVRRGERLLLVLDDTPAFPAAFLGAIRMGAIPIPVNFLARPEDFGYFMDDSYAVGAIFDPAFDEKVSSQLEMRPDVRRIDGPLLGSWMAEGDSDFAPVDTHPDDPAFWLYS